VANNGEISRDNVLRLRDSWAATVRREFGGASVLVAMSGGVDSSVAAYLLSYAGLKVIGVHFRLTPEGTPAMAKGCCHTGSANDVTAVCERIGATAQVWNLTDTFQDKVIDYFENSYLTGETPNPCVECNRELKWGVLWNRRNALGIDYISTGHYARRVSLGGEVWFARGRDRTKDQAYALWPVVPERRKYTMLPLGGFRKTEIRIIAAEANLPTAKAQESQDICFLAGTDYRDWLQKKHPDKVLSGKIQSPTGEIFGTHENLFNYTVGQRKGLGGGYSEPQYVVDTDVETATVVIGPEKSLYRKRIIVRDIIGSIPDGRYSVQIRYRDPGTFAEWTKLPDGSVQVDFDTPVRAPARGQSCVAFTGERVVAGGIIDEVFLT